MARNYDTGTDHLTVSVENHVAWVTLNRPGKRNAMSPEMVQALGDAMRATENDDDVRVVVLTGAGKAFCAGGDVSSMGSKLSGDAAPSRDTLIRALRDRQEHGTLRIFDHAKPTIAALPGPAAGAGMGVALACDLRIAADNACIVPAFGAIGLSGDWGGTWLMQNLIGPARAKEVFYTGRRIYAEEGKAMGLFNRVVPADDLAEATRAFAGEIAAGAPIALRNMKANHNRAMTVGLRDYMREEASRMVEAMQTEDHKDAAQAFLEKRAPTFRGR